MKVSTLMIITAILAFLFGIGFMVAPAVTIGLYGNTLDTVGLFVARYFGAALLGLAFLAFYNRKDPSDGVLAGFFVAMVLGLVVSVYDALAGLHNAFVWVNVAIYLLLGIGFASFVFKKA